MANRWDVCSPRERDGKTYWIRVGTAFEGKDGKPPMILLDALPIVGQDGACKLVLFEPKEKGERANTSAHGGGAKHHDPTEPPF